MTKRLRNYDIVLRALAEMNGSSNEIAAHTGMSLVRTQGAVHRLVADGKVARCSGPRGKNGEARWCLSLSPKSRADLSEFWVARQPQMRMCEISQWALVAGSFDELVAA